MSVGIDLGPVIQLLVVIVALSVIYFVLPDGEVVENPQERTNRNLEHEHRLGAHRQTRAAGCPKCKESK